MNPQMTAWYDVRRSSFHPQVWAAGIIGATVGNVTCPTVLVERRWNAGPLTTNALYGGRDELRPSDYQPNLKTTMKNTSEALGILETQGLTAILEATDAMLKAANVKLVGKEKIGAAYVTVIIRGDVAAVKAAIEAGQRSAAPLGKVIAAHVIARPLEDLTALLPG